MKALRSTNGKVAEPLRILFLVPDFIGLPGGISRYCRLVQRALEDTGARVTVIALNDAPTGDRAQQQYFPCGRSHPTFILRVTWAAIRLRPAVIIVGHAHFSPLGWLVGRPIGARVIVLTYGIEVWKRLRPLRRWGVRHADRLLAISDFTRRKLVAANGLQAERIQLLYNCLDPSLDIAPRHDGSAEKLSLLTVARIDRSEGYKGHDIVIRAMPELLRDFPHLVYDIVGDGAGRQQLENLAATMGVAHAVRFHGVVSEGRLKAFYAEASLFVMPSYREGFGFVFIEAMAQGLPVIGGNLDATPEVIRDGETGYLVDPHSVEEVGGAIGRLLADGSLRARMGQNAARQVRERFAYEHFRDQLLGYVLSTTAT